MIKGESDYDIIEKKYIFSIWDDVNNIAYTFDMTEHKNTPETKSLPVTRVNKEYLPALKGLAEALQQLELFPKNPDASELKATKYHLEDMRNLVMKGERRP